jgi:hypothetical protein
MLGQGPLGAQELIHYSGSSPNLLMGAAGGSLLQPGSGSSADLTMPEALQAGGSMLREAGSRLLLQSGSSSKLLGMGAAPSGPALRLHAAAQAFGPGAGGWGLGATATAAEVGRARACACLRLTRLLPHQAVPSHCTAAG